MKNFIKELQRRNVIKSSISYVALSWVLLEASDIIFPVIGIPQVFIKYVLISLIIGFPFWVAFAYIFELTPSGFRKTSEIATEQSEFKSTSKRLNAFIIVGLSLAVALLLTDRIFNITGRATVKNLDKSIAVLPFTNMSNDPEQEYFSDGLTDDILTQLAKIEEFRVISRTSVMQFKNNPVEITEIGRKLKVDLVLEGSVQKSGNQLRITAQLINAKTDEHIWAESYDRPVADLFSIQREVALSIADLTRAKLSHEEHSELNSVPTSNIEAYQLFQRGEYYLNQPHYTFKEWSKAIEYFNEAVNLDPQFAEAISLLAKGHARIYYLKSDYTEERKNLAEDAAEKALSIDAKNPFVQLNIGYYYLWAKGDKQTALSYFEQAAEKLENNVEVLKAKASIYEAKGDWDKYIKSYEKGVEISPLDISCNVNLAFGYFFVQRFDEAKKYNAIATSLAPEAPWNHLTLAFIIFAENGPNNESRRALERVPKDNNWYVWAFYFQELYEGNFHAALELLEQFPNGIDNKSAYIPKGLLAAYIYTHLGEEDKANDAYESALESLKAEITTHPSDHRFQSALGIALAGTGNRQEAIEAGKKAIEILPLSKDAFYGVSPLIEMALIYDILDETDLAMDHLEMVLEIPNYYSVEYLRRDVRYKNLRTTSRYEELLKKYTRK